MKLLRIIIALLHLGVTVIHKASMYHMLLVTVSERVLSWSLDNGQTDFSPPSFS